jgi:hypothetical protein
MAVFQDGLFVLFTPMKATAVKEGVSDSLQQCNNIK